MLLEPFNKANCLAMLNTLYPPTTSAQPTAQLTGTILNAHRQAFFRYIFAIEGRGKSILDPLIKQGIQEGDVNGWRLVRDTIDKYLRAANGIIDECYEVNGKESLEGDQPQHKARKIDSGISFSSSERPSTSTRYSHDSTNSSTTSAARVPSKSAQSPTPEVKDYKPGGSTLEKIAKEIRKMRSRGDIRDTAKNTPAKPKTLKKMRSASILGERDRNLGSSVSDPPPFDVDEFKRKRMLWEAQNSKRSDHSKHSSNEF
jgi:hypothetical protein